jgi:membrane protease YdiL (CAAX protease family)
MLLAIVIILGIILTVFLLIITLALHVREPAINVVMMICMVLEAIAVTAAVILARRFLDQRSLASLGLHLNRAALPDFLVGFLISGVMMGLIFLIMCCAGWVRVNGFAWQTLSWLQVLLSTLLMLCTLGLLTGWSEELVTRGYLFSNLTDGLNRGWAVVITSVVFGLLHRNNPGATWVAVLGLILAGLFFAYARLRIGNLWLPIGIHAGWNFFEGVVIGFPVSGLNIFRLTHLTISGPTAITGGAFGPEAGIVLIPAMLLGMLLIHLWGNVTSRAIWISRAT